MAKSYNPRRAKLHRSYTVAEAAGLFRITRAAVRAWVKAGLPTVQTSGPLLILGADLQTFLTQRQAQRRRKCPPGTLYCLSCREPRQPAPSTLVLVVLKVGSGNVKGRCAVCGSRMNQRAAVAKLDELGFGDVRQTVGGPNLVDSPSPCLKRNFERTPCHDQAEP